MCNVGGIPRFESFWDKPNSFLNDLTRQASWLQTRIDAGEHLGISFCNVIHSCSSNGSKWVLMLNQIHLQCHINLVNWWFGLLVWAYWKLPWKGMKQWNQIPKIPTAPTSNDQVYNGFPEVWTHKHHSPHYSPQYSEFTIPRQNQVGLLSVFF